ncbi:antitoxin Xre/MbcA/ParS toxin-binding domain-containing protein [Pseudomonas sp. NPDC090208]|uniref:antitoxin Xre/MbcA/ParS toxin-binding domain-containing protein n=1 Tax=Pseudomonas sp. NPDC090208 TaxID=3364478 RepID=UPI003808EC1C
MKDLIPDSIPRPRQVRGPTETLTKRPLEELGDLDLLILVLEGFALKDVHMMVSSSTLYTKRNVICLVMGKPEQQVAHLLNSGLGMVRLNAQQSAMAFQFAKTLEQATTVFGTQALAEDWLCRPSRYFGGHVPVDLIETSVGFATVERYLSQIHHGVYV